MKNVFSNNFAVRYDPVKQRLSLWSVEPREGKLVEFKLQTLRGMGFAEAAKWIGETLLLLTPEPRAVFLPETKESRPPIQFIDEVIDSMEKRASNSADDLYELSMLYVVRSRITANKGDLIRADALLRNAGALGSKAALESLREDWPELMEKWGDA